MFAPGQNQPLANLSLLLFFKDLSIVRFYDFKKNFRGMCFTVQLSMFGYQVSAKQICKPKVSLLTFVLMNLVL